MAEVDAGGAPLQEVPAVEGLPAEDAAAWRLQATLLRRLPRACVAGFCRVNEEAHRRFPEGGTTATLVVAVGWEVVVANVGDSCAYLDTGAEVLQVSGNHRLQDSRAEVERIRASGGEVCPSLSKCCAEWGAAALLLRTACSCCRLLLAPWACQQQPAPRRGADVRAPCAPPPAQSTASRRGPSASGLAGWPCLALWGTWTLASASPPSPRCARSPSRPAARA